MSLQSTFTSQRDWSKTRIYAAIMIAAALVQISTWKGWPFNRSEAVPPDNQEQITQGTVPPIAGPSTNPSDKKQGICGGWHTAHRQYNFVCQGQTSFEIYEGGDQGMIRRGSGRITSSGAIEADLFSSAKNRTGHLILNLSADGESLEGPWHGDDPRETGRLEFRKG